MQVRCTHVPACAMLTANFFAHTYKLTHMFVLLLRLWFRGKMRWQPRYMEIWKSTECRKAMARMTILWFMLIAVEALKTFCIHILCTENIAMLLVLLQWEVADIQGLFRYNFLLLFFYQYCVCRVLPASFSIETVMENISNTTIILLSFHYNKQYLYMYVEKRLTKRMTNRDERALGTFEKIFLRKGFEVVCVSDVHRKR